jgi:hypothetical protein
MSNDNIGNKFKQICFEDIIAWKENSNLIDFDYGQNKQEQREINNKSSKQGL